VAYWTRLVGPRVDHFALGVQGEARGGHEASGTVEGTDAYIGVVVGKTGAFGYICDAEGITHWLHGSVKRGDVTLTAATGATVVAQLADGALTGKALLPADPVAANLADIAGVTVHDFAPPSTTPPANPGGVQANVGTTAVGQIAPPDIQVQLPPTPTPRSRVLTVKTREQTMRCAAAQVEHGQALQAWINAGHPLSGPLFDQAFAAGQKVSKECGAGSAGFQRVAGRVDAGSSRPAATRARASWSSLSVLMASVTRDGMGCSFPVPHPA